MKNRISTRLISFILALSMIMGMGISVQAADTITVSVSIETRTVNGQDLLIKTNISVDAGTDTEQILLDLCKKNGISVDNSQGYVAEIGGFKNNPELYHAWSGWMYWVNGTMAMVGPTQYIPKAGDEIRWCFSAGGDMYGNDVIFADRTLALKKQVQKVEAFTDSDYAKYSETELDNLLNLYSTASKKVLEIENYPSKNGKAGGIAGFILANSISSWDGVSREVQTLENKLRFAIEKKEYITAEAVSMSEPRITLVQGQTYKLTASIAPEGATDTALFWDAINMQGESSADVLVAQDGTVTAKQVTSFAAVRARHGEVLTPATCIVKVVAPPEDSNLTGLSLNGVKLVPSFAKTQTTYRAEVSESSESIRITATAPGSDIQIGGQAGGDVTVPLKSGENIVSVISQVPNKPSQTYTIRIIKGDKEKQITEVADNIAESYKNTADQWRIMDSIFYRGRTNAAVNKSVYLANAVQNVQNPKLALGSLAATILTLTAMGENVTAFPAGDKTLNLIDMLCEHPGYQNSEQILDVFSTCFALQAVTPYTPREGSTWDAKKMQDAILGVQLADGSWGYDGKNGDIDMTAMMISALSPFISQTTIKNAIDRALSYLAQQQQDNGGYSSFGSNNANSAQMVLIALCSAGIDASNDARFVKNGYNLIDALFGFVTIEKNGFGFTDKTYNTFATEQGLRAFATYYKFLKDGSPSKGVSPYIYTGFIGTVTDGAVADANLVELKLNNTQLNTAFDPALTSYAATVNETSVKVTTAVQQEGASVTVSGHKVDEAVSLHVGANLIPVVVTAKNGDTKTYTVQITRPDSGSGGETTKQSISFSVLGLNGDAIITQSMVAYQSGDTPYSVLKRVADQKGIAIKTTGSGSSIYISSIDGLAELEHGAKSGWMFAVNGKYYQVSAGSYKLHEGDTLIWRYTADLGNDIGGGSSTGSVNTEKQEEGKQENTAEIKTITNTLLKKNDLSAWELFGLAAAGENVKETQYKKLLDELLEKRGDYRKVTDTAATVLAVSALGLDAQNTKGIYLLKNLLNHERMLVQGVNGPIFALLAYDSLSYPEQSGVTWSRDKLLASILARQEENGGISLVEGETANVDITAMAICALSNYVDRADVKKAVDQMVAFLAKEQKQSAGFALYGEENCESAAQVTLALSSLGISAKDDKRFIKNKKSVFDAMQEYQCKDGTYCHKKGEVSNSIATEQAFMALIACGKKASIYRLPSRAFFDQAEISDWAQDAVLRANKEGIILGSNNRFDPQRNLSRAELAQILVRALKLSNTEGNKSFADVKTGDWFSSAVNTIVQSGLMVGAGDRFRPNDKITREELAVVIARALKLSGKIDGFADMDTVSVWAKDAVQAVSHAGIMQGSGGKFDPKHTVTREMAATVCMRALDAKK